MNKNCAFTICTKSYMGLAKILESSIYKYDANVDFYIFIADELNKNINIPSNAIVVKSLNIFSENIWKELSFKYDVTEFCTCLKPFIFEWLFKNKMYEKLTYLDPDLFFFNSIDMIYKSMDNGLITLTPHFITFPGNSISNLFEDEIRYTGLYNLGFLGLKRSTKVFQMLNWWKKNLISKCFVEPTMFQFTDQKWMDFMSVYFDSHELNIVKDLGWNIAPWNYFERKIVKHDACWVVENRYNENIRCDVVFAHFSGFDYSALLNNQIIQKNIHKRHDGVFDDVNNLFTEYIDSFNNYKEIFTEYIKENYTYDYYSNGQKVEKMHRRIYHSIIVNGYENILDPFDSKGSFYIQLVNKKMFTPKVVSNQNDYVCNTAVSISRKLAVFKILMRMVYKILGYNRYEMLLRLFFRFSKYENNIFLYKKNYSSWL